MVPDSSTSQHKDGSLVRLPTCSMCVVCVSKCSHALLKVASVIVLRVVQKDINELSSWLPFDASNPGTAAMQTGQCIFADSTDYTAVHHLHLRYLCTVMQHRPPVLHMTDRRVFDQLLLSVKSVNQVLHTGEPCVTS